jgi:hypothetical protein
MNRLDYIREWQRLNPEKRKATAKRYRLRNKEKLSASYKRAHEAHQQPTVDELKEMFIVDGSRLLRRATGIEAGTNHSEGYRTVCIRRRHYFVHRLIFAIANGRWPVGDIDHVNMLRSDNRPENLREATRAQNMHNTTAQRNSKSGVKGVSRQTGCNRWAVKIRANGKNLYLGLYEDLELAKFVYECAARKYHGEFARTGVSP